MLVIEGKLGVLLWISVKDPALSRATWIPAAFQILSLAREFPDAPGVARKKEERREGKE